MVQIHITDEQFAGLEKWAEYFALPLDKTIQVILDTALEDLDAGSPLFFDALDPPDMRYSFLTLEEARELDAEEERARTEEADRPQTPEQEAFEAEMLEVLKQADIVAIIGRSIDIRQEGEVYTGICPWDNTPRFTVNPTRKIFYCFACHNSGNVLKYIMRWEGLNIHGAIERVRTLTEEGT